MTKTKNPVSETLWATKPEDAKVHDGAFWIRKQRWGTYVSVGANDKDLVTALTQEACFRATRFYLKGLQEGWDDDNVIKHSGTVGGKL